MNTDATATRWDEEYRRGRYSDDPPVSFVDRVVATLKQRASWASETGLYVGCGNGRNFLPLVDAGLNLYGLDVSPEALKILAARRPTVASRLICEDFRKFQWVGSFSYVIAIQVFQHGTMSDAEAFFRKSVDLLESGALLFVRVNSISTQIYYRHAIIETTPHGGMTVRYDEGPKQGLPIHFFSRDELTAVTQQGFQPVTKPREEFIRRAPKTGHWAQWEMIWQKS